MYANMINGRLLNTPNGVILKFLNAILKLKPRSGFTFLSKRQIHTIAKTMYKLIRKEKKDEKRN